MSEIEELTNTPSVETKPSINVAPTQSQTSDSEEEKKTEEKKYSVTGLVKTQRSARDQKSGGFERGDRSRSTNRDRRSAAGAFAKKGGKNDRKSKQEEQSDLEARVIEVKRVTRVVKGGKRMRFAALVVVGDKAGNVGFGFKKGVDFQDAVAKATKKGKENLLRIEVNEDGSIQFPLIHKYKSARIFLKPAPKGTGLIAGSYLRPVLELVGIQNIYTKVIGSGNKITGVQATLQALQKYSAK
jgi:small subunit ribosomal protein S5